MKPIDQLRAFLDHEEPGLSSQFGPEEFQEYLTMAKDDVKGQGLRYGQKRVVLKASSYAMFALAVSEITRGVQSKADHYDKLKQRFCDMFDQLVRGAPRHWPERKSSKI